MKFILFTIMFFLTFYSFAEKLEKPDKQLRELASELRCMVCQNQSLLDSDSELAKDLKNIIHEKFKDGKSKKEIQEFLVSRYGEFILFKPLFNFTNIILWSAPLLFLFIMGLIGFRKIKITVKK